MDSDFRKTRVCRASMKIFLEVFVVFLSILFLSGCASKGAQFSKRDTSSGTETAHLSANTTGGEVPVREIHQGRYSWDELKKYKGLNVFAVYPDKVMLEYADKILSGYLIVSEYFGGEGPAFSFDSINWGIQFSDSPNTFQLYLQGLGPVQVLSTAYHLTGNSKYLTAAIKIVESWNQYRCSPEAKGNPYVWNDHGAAIRLHSLVMLAISSEKRNQSVKFWENLWKLLVEHAVFLSGDAHYTFRHNHGIMQDIALLEVAFLIPSDSPHATECAKWIKHAKDRLGVQKSYAYSKEMVHVENSIGYHKGVTELFSQISDFLVNMRDESASNMKGSMEKAQEFTDWATMPNGVAAAFGDSFRISKDILFGYDNKLRGGTRCYPKSGYWFYREKNKGSDSTWKLFKAGYSSGTHKHADDCSFMLYGKGTAVFIDPGMYNYVPGDPFRDYLISSSAHNTVTVDEKSYSPTSENAWKTGILSYSTTENIDYVLAFNDMYTGTYIDRHFYSSGNLTVLYDDIISDQPHTYSQLFHLSENVSVNSTSPEETVILVGNTGWRVRIRQYVPTEQTLFCGRRDVAPLYGHAGGKKLNELIDCTTIRYQQHADSASFITVITLEDPNGQVCLKNGNQVHYSDINIAKDSAHLRFGKEEIKFEPRKRFYANSKVSVEGSMLRIVYPNQENCQYAIYLINAKSGEALYKGKFTQETSLSLDLSEFAGQDLLIRTYAKSTLYPQRMNAVTAALIWDQQNGCFVVDDGTVYPHLNLEYLGQHVVKHDEHKYSFTIDYLYSLPSTQKWYVYRNGGYYSSYTTNNEKTLSYTFKEPGNYTVLYYLRTKMGNNEFRNFDQIHIE